MDIFEIVQLFAIIGIPISLVIFVAYMESYRFPNVAGPLAGIVLLVLVVLGCCANIFGDETGTEYETVATYQLHQLDEHGISNENMGVDGSRDVYAYHYDVDRFSDCAYVIVIPKTDQSHTLRDVGFREGQTEIVPLERNESPYVEVIKKTTSRTLVFDHPSTFDLSEDYEYVLHIDGDMVASGDNRAIFNNSSSLKD